MTNKKWTNLIGGIVVAVLVLGGIYALSRPSQEAAGDNLLNDDGTMATSTDGMMTEVDNTMMPGVGMMNVKIALLNDAGTATAGTMGCDLPVLVTRAVPMTTMPLNAALKVLFADQSPWPYDALSAGNFVSHRANLKFDHATLEAGTAKVYLTGELGPLGGECDNPRLGSQIEATARQFATVRNVAIYLNGTLWTAPSLK